MRIDGVCQDEPVSAQGDAVVGDGSVAVRADRLGGENGRAYQIDFTATAGDASCQGSVLVLVPHDRGDTGHHAVGTRRSSTAWTATIPRPVDRCRKGSKRQPARLQRPSAADSSAVRCCRKIS
ncbi:MAG: hypothetical protein R2851_02010 [Caldilineaceae bacterium]